MRNTTGNSKASADEEDWLTARLPRKLIDFLLYEAQCSYLLGQTYDLYDDYGADQTLAMYKKYERENTLKTYGPDHPGVSP